MAIVEKKTYWLMPEDGMEWATEFTSKEYETKEEAEARGQELNWVVPNIEDPDSSIELHIEEEVNSVIEGEAPYTIPRSLWEQYPQGWVKVEEGEAHWIKITPGINPDYDGEISEIPVPEEIGITIDDTNGWDETGWFDDPNTGESLRHVNIELEDYFTNCDWYKVI